MPGTRRDRQGWCIPTADFLIVLILLGIAVVGVAVTVRYRSDMHAVRERIDRLGSWVVRTGCGPIECARVGNGYPVLVVHGNAGGFDQGLMLAGKRNRGYHRGGEAPVSACPARLHASNFAQPRGQDLSSPRTRQPIPLRRWRSPLAGSEDG